jgi:hypothetical protein
LRETNWREATDPDGNPVHRRIRDGGIFIIREHPAVDDEWTCGVQAIDIGFLDLTSKVSLEDMKLKADQLDLTGMREKRKRGEWPPPIRRPR